MKNKKEKKEHLTDMLQELSYACDRIQEQLDSERETYKTAAQDLLPFIKEAALNLGCNYIRPEI